MPSPVVAAQRSPGALDQPLGEVQEDARVRQFLAVYLKERDFHFEPGLPLDEIDLHSSLRAQVRPTARDSGGTLPRTVEQYIAMREKDGTHFPPGIAHALENGRKELLDARQRVEAARALGMTRLPFYVITTDDQEVLWQIAVRANAELNGVPPNVDDVEQQILAYKTEFPNVPNVFLAVLFKTSEQRISKVINAARTGERLEQLGFKTQVEHPNDPDAVFTPSIINKLGSLHDTPVLKAAGGLIKAARPTNTMVAELVKEVGQQASEADRIAVIEAKREDGWATRINKVANGVVELPDDRHPVRDGLMRKAEVLARALSKYKSPAQAEMTDAVAAQNFWGYIIAIEMSARRVVGPHARLK